MARDTELTKLLHAQIVADYKKLSAIKEHGVQKLTHKVICAKLGAKHFLKPDYIAKIWQRS